MKVANCPKCNSDLIDIKSNRSVKVTTITCTDCGFGKRFKVCEEDALKVWNKEAKHL